MFSIALVRGSRLKLSKDEAQPRAADARQLGLAQPRDVHPFQTVVTARGPVEATEDRHQRRLAGAGRAHDRDEFACLDDKVDPAQRLNFDVAEDEGPRYLLHP